MNLKCYENDPPKHFGLPRIGQWWWFTYLHCPLWCQEKPYIHADIHSPCWSCPQMGRWTDGQMEHLSLFSHGTLWGMCLFEPMRRATAKQAPSLLWQQTCPLTDIPHTLRVSDCTYLYCHLLFTGLHCTQSTQHVGAAAGCTDDGLKHPGWLTVDEAKSVTFNPHYSYIKCMCEDICELCNLCSWSQTFLSMTQNCK